jgi:OOP family OmpA-OmpF porin
MATRKFARGEVKTSSDTLSGRIDKDEGEIKENKDRVDGVSQRVSAVDGRVTALDSKAAQTAQQVDTLRTDVKAVDGNAQKAQSTADRVAQSIVAVDQKFDQRWQNRSQFVAGPQKAVQFKINSSQLDDTYKGTLDQVADMMAKTPDAILVLEGRTDSTGDTEYNVALAQRRADSVQRYLVVEKNIQAYRIHQVSFGAARPIAENGSRQGREQNRAVTMSLFVPKQ